MGGKRKCRALKRSSAEPGTGLNAPEANAIGGAVAIDTTRRIAHAQHPGEDERCRQIVNDLTV